MRGDAWRWPISELYTCYCESSKSLEGDCGMDKVPRCRHFKNIHTTINQKKYKFCKQCGRLNYSRYSHVSLLTFVITKTISISFLLEMVIAKDH